MYFYVFFSCSYSVILQNNADARLRLFCPWEALNKHRRQPELLDIKVYL